MRYVILKTLKNYRLVDLNKGGIVMQERYVIDPDGIILGTVVESFSDPLEAITDLIALELKVLKNKIMEEVRDGRY